MFSYLPICKEERCRNAELAVEEATVTTTGAIHTIGRLRQKNEQAKDEIRQQKQKATTKPEFSRGISDYIAFLKDLIVELLDGIKSETAIIRDSIADRPAGAGRNGRRRRRCPRKCEIRGSGYLERVNGSVWD
jgi:hypothetical protein